jgi:hypothetical protein
VAERCQRVAGVDVGDAAENVANRFHVGRKDGVGEVTDQLAGIGEVRDETSNAETHDVLL